MEVSQDCLSIGMMQARHDSLRTQPLGYIIGKDGQVDARESRPKYRAVNMGVLGFVVSFNNRMLG